MPSLRTRVLAGETLFGVWSDLGSPLAAELLANAGFDWVTIDLEHGAATEADLMAHLAGRRAPRRRADRAAAVRGAAAHRARARPRARRGSWSRASTPPSRRARP